MMGRILGNHPDVYTFKELHFFTKLWAPADTDQKLSFTKAHQLAIKLYCIDNHTYFFQKNCDRFAERAHQFIESLDKKNPTPLEIYAAFLDSCAGDNGKNIPCEQTPQYVYYIQEILDLFPEAKVINMVRDSRDVLLSLKKRWRSSSSLEREKKPLKVLIHTRIHYHSIFSSRFWVSACETAFQYTEEDRVYTVKFEDILKNPQNEIQKVCEFAGISFNPQMIEVPMKGSSLVWDRPDQKGIDKTRSQNWQQGGLNSTELFIIEKITGSTMQKMGYKPARISPNPLLLILYLLTLPVKTGLSFLYQLKDIKSMKEAVKRRLQ